MGGRSRSPLLGLKQRSSKLPQYLPRVGGKSTPCVCKFKPNSPGRSALCHFNPLLSSLLICYTLVSVSLYYSGASHLRLSQTSGGLSCLSLSLFVPQLLFFFPLSFLPLRSRFRLALPLFLLILSVSIILRCLVFPFTRPVPSLIEHKLLFQQPRHV